jgi:hypothetical protein
MTKRNDYQRFLVRGEHGLTLNPSPCRLSPSVQIHERYTLITCPRDGCRIVEGKTPKDAENLWNERDFRSANAKHESTC